MTRLRALWESLRATYWVVPSIMSVAAVALSVGMIQLDQAVTTTMLDELSWVYTGGPEGARAVLSTIASSMITVAGVAFSITIVTLTLASQQFGPRLLRGFLRDLGNQIVLGTLVSTYLYCLLVLRTVRGDNGSVFVPHLAVTLGVVLAMFSLGVLIFFIHHVSTSIQASQVIASVARDLEHAIADLFPERIGQGTTEPHASDASGPATAFGEGAYSIQAQTGGYVQAVDGERLLTLASKHDLVLRIDAPPGTFVTDRRSLLRVSPGPGRDWKDEDEFRDAFVIGVDRTGTQDLAFFFRQLVQLAVRALSPGINDPATACLCIDRLEQALCQLAGRKLPSDCRYDKHGAARVFASPVTFAAMADVAFAEIGQHGGSSVVVGCRLLNAIGSLSRCIQRDEDRFALLRHATAIYSRSQALVDDIDVDAIAECHGAAVAALAGSS